VKLLNQLRPPPDTTGRPLGATKEAAVFTETRSRLGWRTGAGRLAMRHQVGRLQAFDPDERARAGVELVRLGLARSADQLLDHLANEFDHIVLSAIAAAVSEAPPERKESSRAQELREWADAELERLAVEDAFMGPDAGRESFAAWRDDRSPSPSPADEYDDEPEPEPERASEPEPEPAPLADPEPDPVEADDDEPVREPEPIPVERWHEVVATEAERTRAPVWVEPEPADEWDDEPASEPEPEPTSEPEPEPLAERRFAPAPESGPICEWRFEPVDVEAESAPPTAGEAPEDEPEAVAVAAAEDDEVEHGAVEAEDDAPPRYIYWRPPTDSSPAGNGHGHASTDGRHEPEGDASGDEPADEHDDDEPVEAALVEAPDEQGPEAVDADEDEDEDEHEDEGEGEGEPETAYRLDESVTEYRFEAQPAPEPEPTPFDQGSPPNPPRTLAERLKARTG
jgi:hypothetical protein